MAVREEEEEETVVVSAVVVSAIQIFISEQEEEEEEEEEEGEQVMHTRTTNSCKVEEVAARQTRVAVAALALAEVRATDHQTVSSVCGGHPSCTRGSWMLWCGWAGWTSPRPRGSCSLWGWTG